MSHGDVPTRLFLSKGCFPGSSLSRHPAPHNLLWGNEALFHRVGAKDTASSLCRSCKAACVATEAMEQRPREAWRARSQSGQSGGSHSDISRDIRQYGENKGRCFLAEGFNQMKKFVLKMDGWKTGGLNQWFSTGHNWFTAALHSVWIWFIYSKIYI